MTQIYDTIPNLYGGVSQQPATQRLRNAAEEITNGYTSVVTGLQKRPNTTLVSPLALSNPTNSVAVFYIDRDVVEKYVVLISNGDISVFDLDGVAKTVTTTPAALAYLNSTDPAKDFRVATVRDTSFILNRSVNTAVNTITETRNTWNTKGTVFVKQSLAGVTYKIKVNGVEQASFTTNDGISAATQGTNAIADDLKSDLVSNGFTAEVKNSTISFDITVGDQLEIEDGRGGVSMTAFTTYVQDFEDLPGDEIDGRIVKVAGDLDKEGDDYWVEWSSSQRAWRETIGINAQEELDNSTMPHVLVRLPNGTFEFKVHPYAERAAGDVDTNKSPSFIGLPLNDIFVHRNRLGVLADENVILSEIGIYENFYRTTVTRLADSDVVDVSVALGRVETLFHAVPLEGNLILFSDKGQFRIESGQPMTALNSSIIPISDASADISARPTLVGNRVVFPSPNGDHTLFKEIFVSNDTNLLDSQDISLEVPKYVPNNIAATAGNSKDSILLAHSPETPNKLYVYKWMYNGPQKLQNAWSTWEFPQGEILGIGFISEKLYIVTREGSEVLLSFMTPTDQYTGLDSTLLLDASFLDTDMSGISYDPATGKTTLTTPYSYTGNFEFYQTDPVGVAISSIKINDNTYELLGDYSATDMKAGIPFEFRYVFSPIYPRVQAGGIDMVRQEGRLQLRDLSVQFTNSSYFEAHVQGRNGVKKINIMTGRPLNDPTVLLGVPGITEGEFKVPVMHNSREVTIELYSDKPFPCSFGAVEWRGQHYPRSVGR